MTALRSHEARRSTNCIVPAKFFVIIFELSAEPFLS